MVEATERQTCTMHGLVHEHDVTSPLGTLETSFKAAQRHALRLLLAPTAARTTLSLSQGPARTSTIACPIRCIPFLLLAQSARRFFAVFMYGRNTHSFSTSTCADLAINHLNTVYRLHQYQYEYSIYLFFMNALPNPDSNPVQGGL